jgi:hypothetical protein
MQNLSAPKNKEWNLGLNSLCGNNIIYPKSYVRLYFLNIYNFVTS